MIIFRIVGLIFWLFIVPVSVGFLPLHFLKNTERTHSKAIILGYIVLLALLEQLGIPVALFINYSGYYVLMGIYIVGLIFVAGLGLFITMKDNKRAVIKEDELGTNKGRILEFIKTIKSTSIECKVYAAIIILLLIFQLFMALRMASFDVDDAYYNAYARTAQQYGTLYRADPNTGKSIPVDMRHAMALFPVFQAIVSTLSNTHLLIVAHKVMPLILIPLSYLLLFEIGKCLFPDSQEKKLIFLLLMNIFKMFGNISEYTVESFFYIRTWQGKSLVGNFILPTVIWLFLYMMQTKNGKDGRTFYVLLGLLVLASGAGSSLAVMLSVALIILLGILFAVQNRDRKILIKSLLSCIPGYIYILIYILA